MDTKRSRSVPILAESCRLTARLGKTMIHLRIRGTEACIQTQKLLHPKNKSYCQVY
jgi:hypothetical protein